MDRKVTPEQQRQKDRIEAARKEIKAAIDEHQCFLLSEGAAACWICNRPYIDGKFANATYIQVQAQRPVAQPKKTLKPKECFCETDQDGECSKCKGIISDMISKMIDLGSRTVAEFKNLKNDVRDPHCVGCGQRYVDWAIANAFRKVFMQFGSKELAQEILAQVFKAMQGFGITEAPLTQKAWIDVCQEKHWL